MICLFSHFYLFHSPQFKNNRVYTCDNYSVQIFNNLDLQIAHIRELFSRPVLSCFMSAFVYWLLGRSCEFVDPCMSNPCHTQAKCVPNNLGGKECRCPKGWRGEDCSEDVDECTIDQRSPCEHNGRCINLVSVYSNPILN